MIRSLIGTLFMAAAALCGMSEAGHAQPLPTKTRHVREAVVNGRAAMIERLPASQTLRLDIVLALRNPAELDNFLEELYDPTSPSYRHFVAVKEFTERFGPSQEEYDAVVRFAETNGFDVTGGSRDAMDVQLAGSVAAVEKAFHVTMGVYPHPVESRTFYAPDREPTVDLPFELWHISGLDDYSIPRPLLRHKEMTVKPAAVKGSCPDGSYCGSDMRAAYYGETTLTGAGQTVGLLEFEGYDIADLQTYFKNAGQTNNVPVNGVSANKSSLACFATGKNSCDDREQILDMVQAISMAPGLDAVNVYVGSTDTAILSAMSAHRPLDAQLSSSWTWAPSDPETADPYFKKFAAQGQNFFQASGDSGGYSGGFLCIYPGYDAYVTSVGGTDLLTASAGGAWASETAWKEGGGGYCATDNILIPSWQQLSGVITSQNKGSATLRNSPDVAAEANYDFYTCADQEACQTGWGGTSFAAPMWAGYLALVNQQAVANGQPRLGFINPILYPLGLGAGYGTEFHDIVSGSNHCCGDPFYWPAVPGYDLATGWGSPQGAGLIDALAPTGGSAAVSFSPTSVKWPSVAVGKTSSARTVTLTNSGTATLNITQLAVSGDFALETVRTSCQAGSAVPAGANCIINVTFSPTATGARTGSVTITDNTPGSPNEIGLTGTGK
ncbi:MAG: protease pro-enzyme activation domain-containing protein [Terriglobales bacterium]